MEQYVIYLRKSRKDEEAEQRGEGETLARHERILLDYAKRLHLNVTEIYREIVSGETIATRPMMQRLLSEVEQGMWTAVLVMEVERLARGDTIDQGIVAQTFKYSETKIITPMKTYDPNDEYDEEYFEFGLFMSRREYKTINRRLQQGRAASAQEGRYVTSIPPYGYVRKKIEHDRGYTLEPYPEQAEIVKMIFDLYAYGDSHGNNSKGFYKIACKLNDLNIPTQSGGIWSPQSVRNILKNPVYVGKIRWRWRAQKKKVINGKTQKTRPYANEDDYTVVDGLHEPIIDKETYNIVQSKIKENAILPVVENRPLRNPLAGLIICGKCGRHMVRKHTTRRDYTIYCPGVNCDNVSSFLTLVEERIIQMIFKWVQDYKAKWDIDTMPNATQQITAKQKTLKRIENEISSFDKQMDNIHNLLEKEVYTIDVFLERSKALSEKIEKAKIYKVTLEAEIKRDLEIIENRTKLIPKMENLLEVYNSLPSPKEKNDMLKEVIDKIVYIKTVKGKKGVPEDEFELVLFPKLPKK